MDSCGRAIYQKMGLKARSGRVQVLQKWILNKEKHTYVRISENGQKWYFLSLIHIFYIPDDTESAGFEL